MTYRIFAARIWLTWRWLGDAAASFGPGRCRVRRLFFHSARLFPEPACYRDRIDAHLCPPRALIARAMHRSVMSATERNRELITDLTTKRTWLRESEVVEVQLVDKTRLRYAGRRA